MSPRSRPVALVTGASSGIGLELAKVFASEGYDLLISSDNRAKLKKAATQITPIKRTTVQIIVADGFEHINAAIQRRHPDSPLNWTGGLGRLRRDPQSRPGGPDHAVRLAQQLGALRAQSGC